MKRRVLLVGGMLAGAIVPAHACDLESAGAATYLAQYDYGEMAEQEKAAAQARILEEFHNMKMAEARAAFVGRFKSPSVAADAVGASGSGSKNAASPTPTETASAPAAAMEPAP
jgi:hypothetical protein